jgi:type IV secretion system protein VirB8
MSRHWVATIQYAYTAPSADPAIRRWNPIGFRLLEFVAEPEVAGEQTLGADAPSTAGAAADGTTAAPAKVAAP